ncbi:MAG: HAMP domain-containing sensor histidine kinase [Tetrasphaera sp.]
MLALTAAAMALVGTADAAFQNGQLTARVDRLLAVELAELRALAANPPLTERGAPVASTHDLLRLALSHLTPGRDEIYLGLLDRKLALMPSTPLPVRVSDLDAVIAQAGGLQLRDGAQIRQLDTPAGPVRFLAVPVRVGSARLGTFVAAVLLGPQQATLMANRLWNAAAALGALMVIAVAGWVVAGRLLRPLRQLRSTAMAISSTDLTRRIPVDGDDDLADLARAFNSMLGRLQLAFQAQQRFLDDAGHELRTPVTIVQGHLDVVDPGDPVDVASTIDLATDELRRMSRLIDDLTILARAGRPDFVRLAPVDIDRLLSEVLCKATALGDRRWVADGAPAVVVEADEQRLQQALLQLADNAVRHTQAGGEIGIGAADLGERVRLWVRDDGDGVSRDEAERIFERFVHGTNGRTSPGSGLGLSIVRAIMQAHSGRAGVTSGAAGTGSVFWLELPSGRGVRRVLDDAAMRGTR